MKIRIDDHKDYSNFEIETLVRRLGWLSSYSRQILLVRNTLRVMEVFLSKGFNDFLNNPDSYLRILRMANEILSGANILTSRYAAPYLPKNKPRAFFISENRGERLVCEINEISIGSLPYDSDTLGTFFYPDKRSFGAYSGQIRFLHILNSARNTLAREIEMISAGVTLSNKELGDVRCRELVNLPLWPMDQPPVFAGDFHLKQWNIESSGQLSYWQDWYQGFLDGKPLDWELQRRVALIPDEDWEQGPEHIAEKIEEIRAEYLAEKTPLAEKVELNEATGKFNVVPIPLQNQPLIGATLAQVSDALDDALENPANGLNDRSRETRVIRRTVERYGNDPQRIEMDFTTVHAGLTRQIASDELPASEENTALIEALREGAQSIRATHPEVAANREILNKQAFAELSDEQKQVLSDAQPILEDISEGALKEDFAEDIPFLLEEKFLAPVVPELGVPDRNPVLAGYAEAQRTVSRAAKIMIFLKKYPDLVKAIEENSAYKTARIVVRLGGLIAIGLALFQ